MMSYQIGEIYIKRFRQSSFLYGRFRQLVTGIDTMGRERIIIVISIPVG